MAPPGRFVRNRSSSTPTWVTTGVRPRPKNHRKPCSQRPRQEPRDVPSLKGLSLKGVVAGYGGGNVLQGVDLSCAEGTVTCIVGPHRAGKSTVLRVISGLLRSSA